MPDYCAHAHGHFTRKLIKTVSISMTCVTFFFLLLWLLHFVTFLSLLGAKLAIFSLLILFLLGSISGHHKETKGIYCRFHLGFELELDDDDFQNKYYRTRNIINYYQNIRMKPMTSVTPSNMCPRSCLCS